MIPDLVRLLSDSGTLPALDDVSIKYFSPKCGHGVELCSLPRNSTKLCSNFEGKTYLFTGTASGFNNVMPWKMTEVGNNPSFEAGKL